MSKISNSNVLTGGTATAAEANAKFSDVATATSDIDGDNVAYQGIDANQLKDNYLVVKCGYVDNGVTNATAGMPYNAFVDGTSMTGSQPIDHYGTTANSTGMLLDFSSDPLVLKDGDLLRVWHGCHLYKHEYGNLILVGNGAYVSPAGRVGNAVACTYPMWALRSDWAVIPAANGFEPFPGWEEKWRQSTWGSASGEQVQIQQPTYSGSYNSRCYGLALHQLHGTRISSSEMRVRHTGGSTLNYIHQGSDLRVYAMRVFFLGPMMYIRYTATGVDFLAFRSIGKSTAANFNQIYFSHGHVGFMQMRGGNI